MFERRNGGGGMTAKEMFEELEYKQSHNEDNSVIWYEHNNVDLTFEFRQSSNRVYQIYAPKLNEDDDDTLNFSVRLHLAITQQMKELGWIE